MSCSYIIVAGGSRRPFLLTMLSTTLLVMTMIVMTSAQDSAEITSLEPRDGFKIGGRMDITCSYEATSLLIFSLKQNDTIVVNIQLQTDKQPPYFKVIGEELKGFKCDLPKNKMVKCWKNGLQCNDVAQYTCVINIVPSPPKSLKVKSSIRSLREPFPPPEENQISTFTCDADVASSESSVTFRWTVNRGNNIDGVESEDRRVQVPKSSNCYTTVKSDYRYNVTLRDSSNTTITCTIFSESRSHTFSIPGRIPATEAPIVNTAGGLDGGTIAGIVLGVIALIVLVVLLIWFFVIRKKADKPDTKPKSTGPPPTRKDYDERENAIYAKTDKMKTKQTGRANANPRNNQDIGVYTVEGKANPVMNVEDEDDGGSYSQRYAPGSAV
ncbi:XP_029647744.1uncharacterized protein LOC115221679 isoform X5 [Octopus vulgaris]|uniref:XP_029647744.1uncharacterized protein LOC115221679 isoform X5 n=1 Tax=Octopus vulgaris TaxID=6645 RepID=A0AA36BQE4_OCTVU|nr:XP_029647744.1uncharacterized protein LOC115221679 isoform X5 [Octopus vulgaris]